MERPRLGNYDFKGIKKTEEEELVGKIGLAKQTIVTENTRRTASEVIKKYYGVKGSASNSRKQFSLLLVESF